MPLPLPTVRTVDALRETVAGWRSAGERIVLVPTMGALHAGHLSLVRLARLEAERVVVSIFVNPTQFGPNEDFASYPRREAEDAAKLAAVGTDLLYAPDAKEMYPAGFATAVSVSGVSEGLCAGSRPRHFDGVATVVAKLLLQCTPDFALFGEKDFQQWHVIRRMARDLDIPVRILLAPTLRDPDGLALSSRNAYLTPEERSTAPLLHRSIFDSAEKIADGAPVQEALATARGLLEAQGFAVEYLEARDDATLAPVVTTPSAPARVLVAARLGRTRLIDNVPIPLR